jgi:hypothetical protein
MKDTNEKTDMRPEIADFKYSYSLVESKTLLWKLFKAAVIPKCKDLDKRDLCNLATFYEKLNKVLDEVYR